PSRDWITEQEVRERVTGVPSVERILAALRNNGGIVPVVVIEIGEADFDRVVPGDLRHVRTDLCDLLKILRSMLRDRLNIRDGDLRRALDQLRSKAGNDRRKVRLVVLGCAIDRQMEEVGVRVCQ